MNRPFLYVIAAYLAVTIPLVLLTDLTFNGHDDSDLMRLALYTPILMSAYLMATFALIAAYRAHQRRSFDLIHWPPEWDLNVATWAFTKAVFFTALWLLVAGWDLPDWAILVPLIAFCFGHTFFTAQWLGPSGGTVGRPRE
jgi:hypothetical protein